VAGGGPAVAPVAAWLWLDKSLWRGKWKIEKRDILAHETIHKNFYRIGMNYDFGNAAMSLLALFDHFFGKSSQVPLHEAFTHKTGVSQSSPIKANQGKSRYFCE
jgi:hypothetical protein